jgi:hypothetical protein
MTAFGQNEKDPTQSGFSNQVFKSKELGLTIKTPKGWQLLSPVSTSQKLAAIEQQQIKKTGKNPKDANAKQISKHYAEMEKSRVQMDDSLKSGQEMGIASSSMFTAFKQKDKYSLGVSGMALFLKDIPDIKKPTDYLSGLVGKLDKKKYNVKTFKKTVNGKEFDAVSMTFSIKTKGNTAESKTITYYCSFVKGYALILTATSPAGKEGELSELLNAVKFE